MKDEKSLNIAFEAFDKHHSIGDLAMRYDDLDDLSAKLDILEKITTTDG